MNEVFSMNLSKKYFLLFLSIPIALLTTVFSYAQENYADYMSEPDKIILDEKFDNNNNGWNLVENKSRISEGMMAIESASAELLLKIKQSKDFQIEAMIRSERKRIGIYFDKVRWSIDPKEFLLNADIATSFIKKDIHPPFDITKFNKYTIRKIGLKFYFFINEVFVSEGSTNYIKFLQTEFKLSLLFSQIVDYVKISYLIKNEGGDAKPEEPLQPDNKTPKTKGAVPVKQDVKQEIKQSDKYYGLIIGVAEYDNPKLNLDKPVKDAGKIKELLTTRYSFSDSTTFLIVNPTRQKILSELVRLRKIIGPNDNLLIFYAGHGYWDEQARQGYWWPRDATTNDPSNWLSNSDLREQIRSINSAHTLLISDACFSGGIFKTRGANDIMNATKDIQLLYKMPSRRAITSGTMTEVPDKSVFLEYVVKRLNENQTKFLSAQQLFDSFRAAVINNSSVVPQDGVIADTGDEGGDFIFILKEK